jgi:branched-chain amino acid transport system permease protein
MVTVAFVIVTVLNMMGAISSSLQGQLVPICAYIIMAVSLNLVVGISGELSLGHAGFMSVGAFSGIVVSGMLETSGMSPTLRLLCAVITGAIFAGIAGFLIGIPVLRLRGDYLAIVTLAFGEIIKNIMNIVYACRDDNGFHISTNPAIGQGPNARMLLNGPMGATAVQRISTFTSGFIFVLVTLFVVQNIMNSRQGRAIMACRDNRIAAESIGLNVMKYKLMAFTVSASLAGMGGALFGLNYSSLLPIKFNFNTSVLILVFVVLGGIGNIWGSIIAATILTILPEALRQFADYRMLTYAVVLILVMIFTNNLKMRAFFGSIWEKIKPGKADESDTEGGPAV